MELKYILNANTGALHIADFCYQTTVSMAKPIIFDTEQEAYQYRGKHVHMCKICEKKKEKMLHEAMKSKK